MDDLVRALTGHPVASQLSAVITLRYLSARVLLHRAIVARFLDHDIPKPGAGNAEEWVFLQNFGSSSLEICVQSATEIIVIIHSVTESQHRMLTTWWFSIYYSEFPTLPPAYGRSDSQPKKLSVPHSLSSVQ